MANDIAGKIGFVVGALLRTLQTILGVLWTALVWFVKGFIIGFVLTVLVRILQNIGK